MRIAVDAMGGDHAPVEVVAGAVKWASDNSDTDVILVGQQHLLEKELAECKCTAKNVSIVTATQLIGMDESPAIALRKKRDASIVVATRLVKEGKADAVLSCGSTGAQMAAAIFILGRMEGIERPPIVAAIPNARGSYSYLVDVGANVDCRARQILQFALLGKVYAGISLGIQKPRIALLNNGEEETKGNNLCLEAFQLLKGQPELVFEGNIEGREIFTGKADVIVCDGFIGNVILKTIEGMAMYIAGGIAREIGYLPDFFTQMDYTRIGGAPLLGIEGVSVVCHGSSKRDAVYNGLEVASDCVRKNIVELQNQELAKSKVE